MTDFDAFVEPRIGTRFPSWGLARLGRFDYLPGLVYLVPLPRSWSAWAVPSAGGVCLIVVRPTPRALQEACAPLRAARSGELVLRRRSPDGSSFVVGFVPDDDQQVRVWRPDRSAQLLAPTNNTWTLPGRIVRVALVARSRAG